MSTLHVIRVFTDAHGEHGNLLGVFLDGAEISKAERQAIATELAFSETVYVDDPERGVIQIFTPAAEIPFAGHPTVGTAWLMARALRPVEVLRPPPGEVTVREAGNLMYVTAHAEWCPPFTYVEQASAAEIEALDPVDATVDTYNWAWIDDNAGLVRARGFYPSHSIGEDEATGSAALSLSVQLERELEIHQGEGSVIHARPLGDGQAEIGGTVAMVERREH